MQIIPQGAAIAAHDAGAANMIFAWLTREQAAMLHCFLGGPALDLWHRRFPGLAVCDSLAEALDGVAVLVSGTGWASDLEHRARILAADAGVHSVAVIDHWVNYAMRFERGRTVQLPDEIWVGDGEAERIARATFPDMPVARQANLYLEEQARAAGPVPPEGDLLFLLEPAREDWGRSAGRLGAGEFQALDFLLARRAAAGIAPNARLRLRPHPSDPTGKYDAWLARHPGASLDASPDMATALAPARWVAGMNSAGLVIALEAGRTVISALPPHAPPCVLPHEGILHLARL